MLLYNIYYNKSLHNSITVKCIVLINQTCYWPIHSINPGTPYTHLSHPYLSIGSRPGPENFYSSGGYFVTLLHCWLVVGSFMSRQHLVISNHVSLCDSAHPWSNYNAPLLERLGCQHHDLISRSVTLS